MTGNHNRSNSDVGFGGTIIIVIFVVLCLTILSTLSFTTAYSDLKLSKKTEEITADYYAAHGKAEEKLEEIYGILISEDAESAKGIVKELKGVTVIEEDVSNNNYLIYYESLGDKNQKICVTLNIFYDENTMKPYYEITSWNLANIELPEYEDENYDLWKGIDE